MPVRRSMRIRASSVLCVIVAVAFVAAACGGSGQQYVKNSDDHAYYKVPDDWKLFDEKSILANTDDLSDEQREQILSSSWRTGFDASPQPDIGHLLRSSAQYPTGFARVSPLSFDDADTVSDKELRNEFVDIDKAIDAGQVEMVAYDSENRDGGFHGIRFRARINAAPESEVYAEGPAFTIEQISLLNQAKDKKYSMLVVCSAKCFETNAGRIKDVVDSWTVQEE
jgi:hypothetical protein